MSVVAVGISARNLVTCITTSTEPVQSFVRARRSAMLLPGRLAATDCGYYAFWWDRDIVNLDGLTNNREYQRAIRDGRLGEELPVVALVFRWPRRDHRD